MQLQSWVYNDGKPADQFVGRLQAKIDAEIRDENRPHGVRRRRMDHIAGTIAQADYLGISERRDYLPRVLPPSGPYDYAMAGFRAYRGFDGASAVSATRRYKQPRARGDVMCTRRG